MAGPDAHAGKRGSHHGLFSRPALQDFAPDPHSRSQRYDHDLCPVVVLPDILDKTGHRDVGVVLQTSDLGWRGGAHNVQMDPGSGLQEQRKDFSLKVKHGIHIGLMTEGTNVNQRVRLDLVTASRGKVMSIHSGVHNVKPGVGDVPCQECCVGVGDADDTVRPAAHLKLAVKRLEGVVIAP